MLSFGIFYSLSLILLGLCADARLRYGGAVAVLLVAALVGYASWVFIGMALGYVALTIWMVERRVVPWLAWLRIAIWFVASVGLVIHSLPGYEGLLLAEQIVLKEGSVSTGLYFNHDKVLVAWSLLNWLPLFARSTKATGAIPA